MDNNALSSQNVQDAFLNNLRKDRINITIYLMGGVKLTGKIRSFDKFSVVLESGNLEQLIFKHAISTISVPRGSIHHPRPDQGHQQHAGHQSHQSAAPSPAPTAAPSAPAGQSSGSSTSGASGTSGNGNS
ncbi:MAG: RNA chaperone Hfq [Acidobacteriota bacterium]